MKNCLTWFWSRDHSICSNDKSVKLWTSKLWTLNWHLIECLENSQKDHVTRFTSTWHKNRNHIPQLIITWSDLYLSSDLLCTSFTHVVDEIIRLLLTQATKELPKQNSAQSIDMTLFHCKSQVRILITPLLGILQAIYFDISEYWQLSQTLEKWLQVGSQITWHTAALLYCHHPTTLPPITWRPAISDNLRQSPTCSCQLSFWGCHFGAVILGHFGANEAQG